MRIDLLLVQKKIASTRTLAQEMIKSGQVAIVVNGTRRVICKPSEETAEDAEIEVTEGFATEFVSRAGHKIKGAIDVLNLNLKDKVCLDVGVSTGGFSDVMLKSGAASVLGIDVGHDQTHPLVKTHPKFKLLEKVNARSLAENMEFKKHCPANGFDFICMDVSFISVKLILPELWPLLKIHGELLILIKPQFELGPNALNEKGIIKNPSLYGELERTMVAAAAQLQFIVRKYFPSPIEGKDGNKEFFLFLGKNSS